MASGSRVCLAALETHLEKSFCDGEGVAQDHTKAVFWYSKAAKGGEPIAMCNLGVCYGTGRGVAENDSLCIQLLRKSAAANYAPAKQAVVKAQQARFFNNLFGFLNGGANERYNDAE